MLACRKIRFLPFLFLAASSCYGTTVVFVITPDGIIAGTDLLSTDIATKSTVTGINKIETIKGRFIVSSIGIDRVTHSNGVVFYAFSDLAQTVEKRLAEEASIAEVVRLIEDEATKAFRDRLAVEEQMRKGTMIKSDSLESGLVEYIVGGYDRGVATIIKIDYQLDRQNNRLIGPIEKVVFPVAGRNRNYGISMNGVSGGIVDIGNADSYAYKRLHSLFPPVANKVLTTSEMTRDDALTVVRALISIQAEITPSQVGSDGSRIVILPMRGTGSITTYPAIFPLPETNQGERANQKHKN